MRERVSQQLREIERRYDVKVLYACESGSRGWGFASPDSDYDVRFLYVHPLEWYLRVEAPRDVIELPIDDELDVSGWEWRKALGLLKGANPTLIEWLDSPVVYQQDEETITALKAMVPKWFSPLRARWHYYSTAHQVRFPPVAQQSALAVRLFPLQPNARPAADAARKSIFSAALRRLVNNRESFSAPSNNNANAHAAEKTTSAPLP